MTLQSHKTALVVLGSALPPTSSLNRIAFDTLVGEASFRSNAEALNCQFIDSAPFISSGSVYEAGAFLDDLAAATFPDGERISSSFRYKGYELWWTRYGSLFNYFCEPYVRYRKLLEYVKGFRTVYLYRSPVANLFVYYLTAHGCSVVLLREPGMRSPFPFGVLVQGAITALSLPIIILRRKRVMLFIGDKFENGRDYDFRMTFIYEELRRRHLPFVECIRSLERWSAVLRNALVRRRPVVYTEPIAFIGKLASALFFSRSRADRVLHARLVDQTADPETRFKRSVAAHYLLTAPDDVWTARLMRVLFHCIGIRAAFIPATSERNASAVLGCKLGGLPTVGIMHGVATRYGTPYDFLVGFDKEKILSVDRYGVWSTWWKEYYVKNSDAYIPEQLHVSGPMRPITVLTRGKPVIRDKGLMRVLFISEQVAEPQEIVPYLKALLERGDFALTVKFRSYRDGFEEWLKENDPDLLHRLPRVVRGSMQDAIEECDVVIGSYSTAVLEAFMQLKVPIFIHTLKWGDYYGMGTSPETNPFFARHAPELMQRIVSADSVPKDLLMVMRERYFGDPKKNGSAWVVDTLRELLSGEYARQQDL